MSAGELSIDKLMNLPEGEQLEVLKLLEEENKEKERNQLSWLYPDELEVHNGAEFHPRHLYPKHLEFLRMGKLYPERCAMCANRVGKSYSMGGYETALHLTGLYPEWWEGRVFDRPVTCWAAGKSNPTTRDIIQKILCGKVEADGPIKALSGTGLIPHHTMKRITWQRGTADMIDTLRVLHETAGDSGGKVNGESQITLKSYERGRGSFEGDAVDVIWLDEECPLEIYEECLYRTMTTGGVIYLTFTPLEGLSETVLQYLPDMNPDAEKKKK